MFVSNKHLLSVKCHFHVETERKRCWHEGLKARCKYFHHQPEADGRKQSRHIRENSNQSGTCCLSRHGPNEAAVIGARVEQDDNAAEDDTGEKAHDYSAQPVISRRPESSGWSCRHLDVCESFPETNTEMQRILGPSPAAENKLSDQTKALPEPSVSFSITQNLMFALSFCQQLNKLSQ